MADAKTPAAEGQQRGGIASQSLPMRARHDRGRKTVALRRRRQWIIGGTVAALAGLGGLVGYPLYLAFTFSSQSSEIVDAFPEDEFRPSPVEGKAADARNILLLGSDTRGAVGSDINEIRGQRSDTILLVHIPSDREDIQVISIMRDSWVDIPGRGENKVNAALAFGGVPLVVQTVENLIGVRVDRVAIIDFEGFRGMTNALGGVTFANPVAFRGTENRYSYASGEITVDGDLGLDYVRERQAFPASDYQRVRNQQAFVKGLLSGVLNADTLTSPARISSLVEQVSPYMAVDSGFNPAFIASLGFELKDVRADNVTFMTLPTTGIGNVRGQSVVLIDQAELATITAALREDTLGDYVPPEAPF